MKSSEQMAHDVLNRAAEITQMQENRRKTALKIGVPVLSLCLVAAIGIGIRYGLPNGNTPLIDSDIASSPTVPEDTIDIERAYPAETVSSQAQTESTNPQDNGVSASQAQRDDITVSQSQTIFWVNQPVPMKELFVLDSAQVNWNGKIISTELYEILSKFKDTDCTAVMVKYVPADSYLYNGKTLADYRAAIDTEDVLNDKRLQLLKEGDSLKYGTALCTTGDADGIKWAKSLYEERVDFYGDLLTEYIADGEFLKEKLEADIQNDTAHKQAQAVYQQAYDAAVTAAFAKMKTLLDVESESTKDRFLVIDISKADLAAFTCDDIENWRFGFALNINVHTATASVPQVTEATDRATDSEFRQIN